jgi:hypothetical protein
MKRIIPAFAMIIIMAGIVFIGLGCSKTKITKEGGILSVNEIQAEPAAFQGVIRVTGVVARVKEKTKQFTLLDTDEALNCESDKCALFYLPVQCGGNLPQRGDEVNITGSLVKEDRFIFDASHVDVLRHITFEDDPK